MKTPFAEILIRNGSIRLTAAAAAIAAMCFLLLACSPNQRILESSNERTEPTPDERPTPPPSFEKDIEAMRTADFVFIYVFRRKDGLPLDADDKRFAANVIPPEMNRRTLSDEGKAIIVGSNFRMPDEVMKVLRQRFLFEDYSADTGKAGENIK